MTGWSVLGWACIAFVVTVLEGFAVAIVVSVILSARNSARPPKSSTIIGSRE